MGVKLQQAIISSGRLGIVFINIYWLNALILGFTIIFFVSNSLIRNPGRVNMQFVFLKTIELG